MAEAVPDRIVGDWWRYSVSLVGAILLVIGLTSVLHDARVTSDELLQLGGLVALCLALILVGARIARAVQAEHQLTRVFAWTAFGIVAMAGFGTWWALVMQQTVETAFEMALVFLSVLATGALFGAVVGYYEVRLRGLVERASREAARREFLDEQQETLSSLNRIFRHQILNDLSAISGRSELLAAEKIDAQTATDSIRAHCDHMEGTVARLETIFDVLTHVSDTSPIPVGDAIADAHDRVRDTHPELSVDASSASEMTVDADELLTLALAELFANAAEHGGGDVTVTVEEADEGVVFTVADDGPGIDLTPPESAFDPNARGPDSEGDGLGLFLVELIVDRYDGEVRVAEADDGTAIELVIPRRQPTAFEPQP